jgi:hypothetical protein
MGVFSINTSLFKQPSSRMKKSFWSFALLAVLVAIPFTACKKEDTQPTQARQHGWWIGIGKVFNSCADGGFICIRPDKRPYFELLKVPAAIDEVAVRPVVNRDGFLMLTAEVETKNLSQRVQAQLFEGRFAEVKESSHIGEELLRQAYANANLPYDGQQLLIKGGRYPINVEGAAEQRPPRIIIIITISKDGITITIKW